LTSRTRQAVRAATTVLAGLFLLSCALNFGAKIPPLTFSSPSASIAEFEVVIGLILLAAAAVSRPYPYAGALILATVGILEGLLSPGVQGNARYLHETMIPFLAVGWALLAVEARTTYRERGRQPQGQSRQGLITALQVFDGALVTLGGAAFAALGTYPVGTALGSIHLALGIVGLFGGWAVYTRQPWSRSFLIAVNLVTIVYSAFTEALVELYAYLPPGINDSFIGTVVAIIVSAAIIFMLRRRREP
jgi:hypothetical protein